MAATWTRTTASTVSPAMSPDFFGVYQELASGDDIGYSYFTPPSGESEHLGRRRVTAAPSARTARVSSPNQRILVEIESGSSSRPEASRR
ncbi:hypothetical protein MRX96_017150 [Rhipicephalus microplus]